MKNERGFTLIGVVIAVAILGVIAAGFLGGLAGASRALFTADERTTANNLAESQMEDVKNQDYDDTNDPPQYALLSDIPDGYGIEVAAERLDPEGDGFDDDDGIQKITVTIEHHGREIMILEDYKVN